MGFQVTVSGKPWMVKRIYGTKEIIRFPCNFTPSRAIRLRVSNLCLIYNVFLTFSNYLGRIPILFLPL